MSESIVLQDTGKRTINGSVEFDRVNGGTSWNMMAQSINFGQGLATDTTEEAGNIGSAGFSSPEVGTAATQVPTISVRGTLDLNVSEQRSELKYLAQLARTRGLVKLHSVEDRVLLYHLPYSPDNSSTFASESTVGSGNPLYVRVGKVNFSQIAGSPFRVGFTLNLFVHAE